ncbi:pyridoxal-phosphate dependent enzyme [Parasedimentitalea maritima]|uniref:Pyridoxal-phosphate dependent enzyme n=1 Tax=Parasedimentitalea maritima TaxID=2578117 RepID=A0A6A4RFB5_9RHOB|nr:pyridoxal-phosphate dependent enzyme [Zongyanglinia marina]KAE9629318.1 pyridoxal-phosphate dependent enzyme [Zongyanglinia marina]
MTLPTERVLQSACRSVAARRRIAALVRKTEVLPSRMTLLPGTEIHYKTENFQLTGSFKLRGASAKLSSVPVDRPVITASSGNHGIACSLTAQRTGHKLTVVLPETVIDQKRKAIEAFGTRVVIAGADSSLAEVHARMLADTEGHTYVSPYNDAEVIAGQGTIGLEILEQLPRIDNIFVSMGGGGLISGIGSVVKSVSPDTRIIGVSATNSAALAASIKAGEVVETEHLDTLADGVAGGVDENSLTLPLATDVIDQIVHVNEDQIAEALRVLAWQENMIVEGAAALALAPLLIEPDNYAGAINVVLLCGANYDKDRIAKVLL